MDTIVAQTGTDPKTLQDFYLGLDQRKIRHELFGEEYKEPTYDKFLESIFPLYEKRYREIRDRFKMVDGFKKVS